MKILFVCTGNICRSPMAQVIFENLLKRDKVKGVTVASAGTFTIDGLPMTPTAVEALGVCGEKLGRKARKSRLFKKAMLKRYDHIVCMTAKHAEAIGAHGNVYTIDQAVGCGDVPDPFMQGLDVYTACCKMLQEALGELYRRIL